MIMELECCRKCMWRWSGGGGKNEMIMELEWSCENVCGGRNFEI
jgi:hypothetical protein